MGLDHALAVTVRTALDEALAPVLARLEAIEARLAQPADDDPQLTTSGMSREIGCKDTPGAVRAWIRRHKLLDQVEREGRTWRIRRSILRKALAEKRKATAPAPRPQPERGERGRFGK